MKQRYGKAYFEKYAQLTLEYCYDKSYEKLNLLDKPDLQSKDLDVGIEVTKGMARGVIKGQSSYEGNQYDIVKNYFGKGLTFEQIKEEIKNKYPNHLKNLKMVNKTTALFDSLKNTSYYKDNIVFAIKEKTKKLNDSDYTIFSNNYLYVFSTFSTLYIEDIKEILYLSKKETKEFKIQYDIYFINCLDTLYIVDRKSENIKPIKISNSMLKKIKKEALNYYEML